MDRQPSFLGASLLLQALLHILAFQIPRGHVLPAHARWSIIISMTYLHTHVLEVTAKYQKAEMPLTTSPPKNIIKAVAAGSGLLIYLHTCITAYL
jgi:hypothetical protein